VHDNVCKSTHKNLNKTSNINIMGKSMKKILSILSIAIVFILVCSSFPTINATDVDMERLDVKELNELLENKEDMDWKDYIAILFIMAWAIVGGILILGPILLADFIVNIIALLIGILTP
jgi:hypothetical protein